MNWSGGKEEYLLDHAKQSVRFFRCEAASRGMGCGCGFLHCHVRPFRYRDSGNRYGYGVSDKDVARLYLVVLYMSE